MSWVHPELPEKFGQRIKNFCDWVDFSNTHLFCLRARSGEIGYVTAHVQAIRDRSCFRGAAYPRAPLGSSQGKPCAVQTDPCICDNAASALSAQTSECSSSLWKCLFRKGVVFLLMCVCVCHTSHWYSTHVCLGEGTERQKWEGLWSYGKIIRIKRRLRKKYMPWRSVCIARCTAEMLQMLERPRRVFPCSKHPNTMNTFVFALMFFSALFYLSSCK